MQKMLRYSELKAKADAMDGYGRMSCGAKANGKGPLSDPTAGVAVGRTTTDAVLWTILVDEALRAVSPVVRGVAMESWVKPTVAVGEKKRQEFIAGALHISVSAFYDYQEQFLLELGSRAAAKGLIRIDGPETYTHRRTR